MSVDVPAADSTDRHVPPASVTSHISRESADTYVASHTFDTDDTQYEIRRVITRTETHVSVRREWLVDGEEVQITETDAPVDECIGEAATAVSLLGFVCYEHYAPAPTEQFSSVLAAHEHDAF